MSIEPSDMSVTCSGSGWGDVRTNANDNATKMFENDEKKNWKTLYTNFHRSNFVRDKEEKKSKCSN